MPKNIENMPLPNPDFFIVNVSGERFHSLVPRVARIGHTISLTENRHYVYHRKELEFCFRLSSNEQFAEDEIDGQIYRTEFPHLLIKYPGTQHRYRTNSPRTACFVIYPADTAKVFEMADVDLTQFAFPFKITALIKELVDELRRCEEQLHLPGTADRVDLIALRLISEVLIQNRKICSQTSTYQNRIHRIAAFMESHLTESLDCTMLAGKCGMSLRTFFRRWKEVYRKTPSQYLLELRMEFARHLLLRSNMDIEETADEAGFSSAGYFIQAFKRHFGTTPGAFRREHIDK